MLDHRRYNMAFGLVGEEIERASEKWPTWPVDPVHGAAVVCEESGELMQSALNAVYHDADADAMLTEAIHTAATAIRFIAHFRVMRSRGMESPMAGLGADE